jgi:hypothetical protein
MPSSFDAKALLTIAVNRRDLCPSDLGVYTYLCLAVEGQLTDCNGHPLTINCSTRTWTGTTLAIALNGFNDSRQQQVRDSLRRLALRGYIVISHAGHLWSITLTPILSEEANYASNG